MAEQWAVEVDVKKSWRAVVGGGGGGQAHYFVRMRSFTIQMNESIGN